MSSTTAKPEETILIAVMGLTGTGKSTFINLASGSDLRVGHSVASCTSTVDVAQPFNLDGRDITLYDTPGFNDTNLSETEILKIIASELETRYRNNYKLHGIIYMHRISDIRVGGLEKSNFGVFRKLCGETSLKNVVIVTNMWSRVPSTEEGERRARELETMDDFFKPAILKGARFMHHREETVESAHDIIRSILKNHPVALDLQTQLVDEHRPIDKTSAGMEVGKKFTDIVAKYEKKLREQMQAAKQAQKRSAEMRQLQKEAQKAKDAIAKLEAERANQAKENERLRKQMEEMEERRKREAALRIVTGTIKSGHLHTIRSTSSNAYQGVNIRNSYIDGYNSYTGISQQQVRLQSPDFPDFLTNLA
ncbi:hypothetical protein BYT27DRAFT_7255591 [Phlegmacium glaucopus]|nr:hypothetical protein BYT27DRAFT_7255591 [Phlegmacium glaucopus]